MSNKIKFTEDDLDDDLGAASSDEEFTEREKYLVKKYKDGKKKKAVDSDEEVLGFGSSDDDEEEEDEKERFEADSDIASDREDGIPDAKAWGKTKSSFYNTNYVDQDYSSLSVREEEHALFEEQEARTIQMQLAKHLKEADFSLDVFTDGKSSSASDGPKPLSSAKSVIAKVKADLSGLTVKQKAQLLKKDSPEFKGLVDELNLKIEESYNELEPIIEELQSKQVPASHPICCFIRLKNQLHLTYATNITFYLLLKANQKPIKNHPILKRLVQLKELLSKLDEKYEEHIRPEVERLLEDLQSGRKITFEADKKTKVAVENKMIKKKLNIVKKIEEEADLFGGFGDNDDDEDMDDDDEEGKAIERQMKDLLKKVKQNEADEMEEDAEDGDEDEEQEEGADGVEEDDAMQEMDEEVRKRKITYQMAKNKGLTPHRKKEQRNPRVKHREKFRKALIRRKGAIRTVRTETTRYSGEHSGIKSTVRKGIQIK